MTVRDWQRALKKVRFKEEARLSNCFHYDLSSGLYPKPTFESPTAFSMPGTWMYVCVLVRSPMAWEAQDLQREAFVSVVHAGGDGGGSSST